MSMVSNILSYFSIDRYESFTRTTVLEYNEEHSRYDDGSMIRLANGSYLMAITRYGDEPQDGAFTEIAIYSNSNIDNQEGWSLLAVIPNNEYIGISLPSIRQRANGTLVMVCFETVTDFHTRMLRYTSSDNGATWSSFTVMHDVEDEYMNFGSDRLFIAQSGRWFMPYSVAALSDPPTNENIASATGNYTGYMMYSDDEWDTVEYFGYTMPSPDDLIVECGFYQINTSTLVAYFRNRSNTVFAYDLTDNGATKGILYDLGIPAVNSMTKIVKLSNGGYLACYNPTGAPDRKWMNISYSSTGLASSFGNIYSIEVSNIYKYIIPFGIESPSGDYFNMYYSVSDVTFEVYDLVTKRIPFNTYL